MRRGWFGNSRGHALAARGVRLYPRKQRLHDPLFFAQRREERVPTSELRTRVRRGANMSELVTDFPGVDREELRLRAIKAVDSLRGDDTLALLNRNGVDASVHLARVSNSQRKKMLEVLNDSQASSFLSDVKVELLKKRLSELI